MPKVSVIMSVYNTKEEYLREAVESILNQTFKDYEFIIINDGSTNNAENVILSYQDKRIKYFKQENQGISKTRNRGFDLAKGEYIAVMDSDDISLPERFEKQVNFFNNHPDISILGSWFEKFPNKVVLKYPEKPKYLDILKSCCIGHPTVMFRKNDFIKYNLKYDENFIAAVDYELWSRAIKNLNFYNIQEVLLEYRWSGDNISITKSDIQRANALIVKQNMLNFLTENTELQNIIKGIIFNDTSKHNIKFFEKIFSIKNEYTDGQKYKIVRILGLTFDNKKIKNARILRKCQADYPKVMTTKQTINALIEGKSIARFGDGELEICLGKNIYFQEYDEHLSKKLKYILKNPTKNCLVGINYFISKYNNTKNYKNNLSYWENYRIKNYNTTKNLYDIKIVYANSEISRSTVFYENVLEDIQKIWNNKKVLFVVGNNSHFIFDNKLFSNIKEAQMIVTKGTNAYTQYRELLSTIKNYSNDWLIFLSLGPTATVLAYELSNIGYQALDFGHLSNCFLEFLGQAPAPESKNYNIILNKEEGIYTLKEGDKKCILN